MTTLDEAIVAYRICAQAEGKSPKTIRWIESSIRYFKEFLEPGQIEIAAITTNDFRRFVIHLQEVPKFCHHHWTPPQPQKLSPESIRTYARAIRAFFGHLAREELIPANPLEKVKMPKSPVKLVVPLTAKEVGRLLAQPNKLTNRGFRDYAIILTFLDTAGRLSEITCMDVEDVDLDNGYIRVMGKGGKERFIPFGQKLAKVLLKYKLKYRPQPVGTSRFWLSNSGEPLEMDRVRKIFTDYGKKAGLKRCYPHLMRHTSAIMYLRNGGDPFSLQKKLGHSSLQMTRHYSNLADSDVRAKQLKFGVVDHLDL